MEGAALSPQPSVVGIAASAGTHRIHLPPLIVNQNHAINLKNVALNALEEAQEIGMSNIDEHIVQIYNLLNDVVLGSRNLHVTFGNTLGGSWSTSGSFTPSGVPGSL